MGTRQIHDGRVLGNAGTGVRERGMAGAALRKWALTLNGALADQGIYVGHGAIGGWLAGAPGIPAGASVREPDDVARLYWDLHTSHQPTERLISDGAERLVSGRVFRGPSVRALASCR